MDETITPDSEPKKIKKVRYFAVELSTGQPIANFTNQVAAEVFANEGFFEKIYGEKGNVVPIVFNVYDYGADAIEQVKASIKETAMAKLSEQEKYVLSL